MNDLNDYSLATFQEIVKKIRAYIEYLPKAINKLSKLKREISKRTIDYDVRRPVLEYIEHNISLFTAFENELKRLLSEILTGVKKKNIYEFQNLIKKSQSEEQYVCLEFKREYISRPLKDEALRSFFNEIYVETRTVLSSIINLTGIVSRLEVFIGLYVPQHINQRFPRGSSGALNTKNKNIVPFKTPVGSRWEDVKIKFLSSKAVDIRIGNIHEGREYAELGFLDERNNKSNILWLTLASFGKCGDEISRESSGLNSRITKNLKSHVNRLGKILIQIFQIIEGSPFEYVITHSPSKYQSKLHIEIANEDAFEEIMSNFAG